MHTIVPPTLSWWPVIASLTAASVAPLPSGFYCSGHSYLNLTSLQAPCVRRVSHKNVSFLSPDQQWSPRGRSGYFGVAKNALLSASACSGLSTLRMEETEKTLVGSVS